MKLLTASLAALTVLGIAERLAQPSEYASLLQLDPTAHVSAVDQTQNTCSPGPARLSDMGLTPGGFLKAREDGSFGRQAFYFTRGIYSDDGDEGGFSRRRGDFLGDGGPSWSIDYPNSDRHMMLVAKRLTNLDACEWEHP